WTGTLGDEKATKGIASLLSAGTIQAGVGYSAMLAVFYLPARAYVAWQVQRRYVGSAAKDRKARQKEDEEAGLAGSWTDEAKQVLALLAPILSAPLLDAFVKK